MKYLKKVSVILVFIINTINAQTTLSIGDISIIGFNANAPDNFTFVTWVDLANNTKIKFTDNAFLSSNSSTATNNGRGGEGFVTWTNNTGATITAGTVIKIEDNLTPFASVGSISQTLSGISGSGDQIFAYQGTGAGTSTSNSDWGSNSNPTTFTGTILFGLNFGRAWLTTGTATSNTSYLPSNLNVTNGNIVISTSNVTSAQFTGSRTNLSSWSAYRTAVNSTANWTTLTGSGLTTLSTTSFTLSCTPPLTQVSALGFTSTSGTGTTISWTNGSGANTIVVAKSVSAVNSDPVSGSTYTANASFGSGTQIGTGNYVVYSGSGTSVAITGLSATTTYYFAVYTFDGTGATSCYKTAGATANVTTPCINPINVSSSSTSNVTNSQATISWTNSACYDEVYVFVDQTSGLGTAPSGNGSSYSANSVYSSNGQCIYNNTGTSLTVTGLTNSSTYYFEIYTRKGSVWSSGVEVSANTLGCSPPSSQVSALGFTGTSGTGTSISWTNGSGANTIVVAKSGSAVNSDPVYGATYTANATFGSGTQIGSGNYVIYSGSGTSVAITGLSSLTTYHFAVYTFDGTGATSCYKTAGATANVTTACVTPINVSSSSTSNATNNQATISWTNSACFDEVYVFVDQTSGLGTAPSGNGSAYSSNSVYSSNGQCIYKSTGTSITVTGLTNSSTYYFEIYTRKGSVWSSGVEVSATPVAAVSMTELVVPQYMASKTTSSANNARTPIAVCLKFDNLTPNTAYDIKICLALTSDASNSYGAGNIFNGTSYSGSDRLNAFTTNGTGSSGAVWFYLQPTGNSSRFGGGQVHELRVGYTTVGGTFPSAPNFESTNTITALDVQSTATASTTDDGAFIKGTTSNSFSGKFVLAFDNVSGTGNPLFAYQVNTALPTNATQSALPSGLNDVYMQSGTSAIGDFPVVVPIGANNSNGVRRFEFRNTDNTFFASITDADGNWGTGMNTTTIARIDFQTINLFRGSADDIELGGDVVLPGALSLSNSLTFNSGKLFTTNSKLLTLKNACTVNPVGGSATSFVDGPMAREAFGNSEVVFPVGKGTEWARASITPRQNDSRGTQSRTYLCEYFNTGYGAYSINTSQTNPLVTVSYNEYWNISEQSSASGLDIDTKIKLYWRALSDAGISLTDRQDMRVAHYTSGMWSFEGSSPVINDNGVSDGTIQSDWVNSFSPFTIGSVSHLNPLPVKLISASATCNKNNNLIQWCVDEDNQTQAFKIEKFQNNQFYPLATIKSKNNNTVNTYFYTHENADKNTIYRISEIGLDNDVNTLATLVSFCKGNFENTIQVIQLENSIEVKLNESDINTSFTLRNALGQVIKVGDFINNLTIDKTFLAKGIYILNIKELNISYKIYVY